MNEFKTIGFSVIFFAIAFLLAAILGYAESWKDVVLITLIGAFVGLVAAPVLEPKKFKHARFFQLISGSFAGGIVGYLVSEELMFAGLGIIIGGLLGVTASFWIKGL